MLIRFNNWYNKYFLNLFKKNQLLHNWINDTLIIPVIIYSGFFLVFVVQNMSMLLDIALPLNESRPRELVFPAEYFIDQQKYFYIISIHGTIGLFFIATSSLATETFSLESAYHSYGLFKIARQVLYLVSIHFLKIILLL